MGRQHDGLAAGGEVQHAWPPAGGNIATTDGVHTFLVFRP
jgi:hypothetical protein